MNVKSVWLGGLVVTLLGLGVVRGQGPTIPASDPGGTKLPPSVTGMTVPAGPAALPEMPPPVPMQVGLSDWIVGRKPCGCCGPVGLDGPIEAEMYMRNGVSWPVGGAVFSKTLDAGWDIEGGVRSLFFNKAEDAAWTVELGVTNIFNPGTTNGVVVGLTNIPVTTPSPIPGGQATTVTVPNLDVTIKNLNRTYVDLAVGREIYLLGNAESSREEMNLRIGADFGGRWGTDRVELNGSVHRTATIGGMAVAIHSDLEIPIGSLIFVGGIRAEWGYTWDQVLQTNHNGENEDLNLLVTLGFRF